jgi:hypothetical protein
MNVFDPFFGGPSAPPSPWHIVGGSITYDGAVLVPSTVAGGDTGPGTINTNALYVNGVQFVNPVGNYLLLTGGTLSGKLNILGIANLSITGGAAGQIIATNGAGVLSWSSTLPGGPYLALAGGTLTGPLVIPGLSDLSIGGGFPNYVLSTNGTGVLSWVPMTGGGGGSIVTGDTPPNSPTVGTLWWDSVGGQLYIWYNDGNTSQWVISVNGGAFTSGFLPLNGGTLTGPLLLAANPSVALGAATKQYVDAAVPLASSTNPLMDGAVAIGTGTTWARADHRHPSDTSRLPIAGGTITGNLVVNGGVTFAGGILTIPPGATGGPNPVIWLTDGNTNRSVFYFNVSTGATTISDIYSGSSILLLVGGGININAASGQQTTINGPATVATSLNVNGVLQVTGSGSVAAQFSVLNGLMQVQKGTATNPTFYMTDGSTNRLGLYFDTGTGHTTLWDIYSGGSLYLDPSAQFTYSGDGNAYKAGGGPWLAPSDARIKTVHNKYEPGLAEVIQLEPVNYTYKGNDTLTSELNRTKIHDDDPEPIPHSGVAPHPASHHYIVAKSGKSFVGLVAQDVEEIFPDIISKRKGFIDGVEIDDMRDINPSNLTYALINAVKELNARIITLETQLRAAQ